MAVLNLYQLVRLKQGGRKALNVEDIEGQLEEVRSSISLTAQHSFRESPLLGHLEVKGPLHSALLCRQKTTLSNQDCTHQDCKCISESHTVLVRSTEAIVQS